LFPSLFDSLESNWGNGTRGEGKGKGGAALTPVLNSQALKYPGKGSGGVGGKESLLELRREKDGVEWESTSPPSTFPSLALLAYREGKRGRKRVEKR